MFETMGGVFFSALRDAAERHLGQDHPCLETLRTAALSNDPAATVAAQEALARLDPAVVDALMADAHKRLRESPDQILGAWKPGGATH